ncbi:MAG: FkbM family methyltransferase, partial [Candidatus Paceibacterota bacterium]
VLGFEAWEENYRLAKENLKELKVETYPLAVWRSDLEKMPILYFREDQIDQTNKGGGDVLFKNEGVEVKTISLDKVLGEYCQGQPIRLLKLDCEGSEFPILFSCTRLSQVQEICGEYHEIGGEYNEQENIPARAQVGNYQKYTIKELTEFLESQGFAVDSFRHPKSPLGMFFAKRDFCP